MRAVIDETLARYGGVASRARLLATASEGELDDEIRRGRLVRIFHRAYCRPWEADLPEITERAALASIAAPVALSHLSALHRWGLGERPPQVHVTVPATRMPRPQPGIRVHRVRRFPPVQRVAGLVTTGAAASVVSSWPLCPGADQRAAAISAVRAGVVRPQALLDELAEHPRLAGRRALGDLVTLLAGGCESELEIWGHLRVFDIPGLRHGVRQHPISVRAARYRIDLAYVAERVAVEMDGDRWHSTPEQRERDRRRDAALASVGWVTLRFSHRRLHADRAGCRADTLATLAQRRQ